MLPVGAPQPSVVDVIASVLASRLPPLPLPCCSPPWWPSPPTTMAVPASLVPLTAHTTTPNVTLDAVTDTDTSSSTATDAVGGGFTICAACGIYKHKNPDAFRVDARRLDGCPAPDGAPVPCFSGPDPRYCLKCMRLYRHSVRSSVVWLPDACHVASLHALCQPSRNRPLRLPPRLPPPPRPLPPHPCRRPPAGPSAKSSRPSDLPPPRRRHRRRRRRIRPRACPPSSRDAAATRRPAAPGAKRRPPCPWASWTAARPMPTTRCQPATMQKRTTSGSATTKSNSGCACTFATTARMTTARRCRAVANACPSTPRTRPTACASGVGTSTTSADGPPASSASVPRTTPTRALCRPSCKACTSPRSCSLHRRFPLCASTRARAGKSRRRASAT